MSDRRSPARRHLRRDSGMSLPEVLIAVVVMGMIATVIAASIIVTFRTQDGTKGRLNVAQAEQSVATWLPADLSSAVDAKSDPADSPCGGPVCDGITLGGSNALMLSWPSGGTTTNVAYIYRPSGDGTTYELVRVECTAGSCRKNVVVQDLEGPPYASFVPGVTPVPASVINVALPLSADGTTETATDGTSNARRIVVTINGGGSSAGAGGGLNGVSITAGGTNLGVLEPAKATGPSFLEARSRCGGPITVIVDDSGSIGAAGASRTVENAVRGFVSSLAGTPTSVQIIPFSSRSRLLEGSGWNHYYDMSDPVVVDHLVGDPTDMYPSNSESEIANGLRQTGGTNWEDAIYRTFYANTTSLGSDGRPIHLANDGDPTTYLPKLVVFFTDGKPTFNRTPPDPYHGISDVNSGGPTSVPTRPSNKWPLANGQTFDQEGWDRSVYLLNPFLNREDIRVIGVGVGAIATESVYAFTDAEVNASTYGIVYRTPDGSGRVYKRSSANPSSLPSNSGGRSSLLSSNTPAEKALGNLMVGVHPTIPGTPYLKATYNGSSWDNFDANTNLLSTSNFSALGEALREIAVGECGGTLTLSTKLGSGALASSDVTYEALLGAEVQLVTTSQIARAAAVDMPFPPGFTEAETTITPQELGVAGYTATGWSCSLRGQPLDPGQWELVTPGNPAQGVTVRVQANQAVSCTMTVAPA